jgi:ubiquinone/menaquinone biosynthesis C-methylase UbiE
MGETAGHSAKTGVRADYGLDAPPVVRNLLLGGVAALALALVISAHLWDGRFRLGPVQVDVAGAPIVTAVICLGLAGFMVWSSRRGKLAARERLLDGLALRGDERVLDVGCGRGLLLLGAARRLTTGSAVGVDLWQSEDLSGNTPEAVLENARREGVSDRIRVETADMRQLAFPDGSFDVVFSRAAIHNVYDREGRAKALREIARVLRAGGRVVIDDIRHLPEYAEVLQGAGLTSVAVERNAVTSAVLTILTFGSLRPGVVRATKS